MKKLLLPIILGFGLTGINAQTTEQTQGMNDIMIDPILMIAAPAANISYERLLNQDSGLGINAIFGLGREMTDFWQVSPYYRMYFGKKFASGFFVEGFVPITSTKEDDYVYLSPNNQPQPIDENVTSIGFGIGFGGKWVVKRNIVFEASGGVGRRFSDKDYLEKITGKGMLGIGYRF